MKPELRDFFSAMNDVFTSPKGSLTAAYPEWSAPPGRLEIYPRFVASHPRAMLEKNYPLVREVLGERVWSPVVDAFVSAAPPRSWEINEAAEGFADFLHEHAAEHGTPSFAPFLARFELAEFRVFAADVEIPPREHVQAPMPNPTLDVLEHPFRLVRWVLSDAAARAAAPPVPTAEVPETVLMWRHPITHRTRFRVADPAALLALKIVIEGVALAAAATEASMTEDALRDLLASYGEEGLLILPG